MKRALLVIDVQNEYFNGKMTVSYPIGTLGKILSAIDTANRNDIPVIIIQHTASADSATFAKGSMAWEVHPEVISKPHKYVIEKPAPGSFTGTGLEQILKDENVDTVVISGYMTQMCCDTTSRQAFHMGYKVEFLSDATGTLDISSKAGNVGAEALHKAILVTQSSVFSTVLSTGDWIKAVES